MANLSGYNFAYLDEQTKRMIRCRLAGARCRCRTAGEPAAFSLPPA